MQHLVVPADCTAATFLKLHVVAVTLEKHAPHWYRHAPIGGCLGDANAAQLAMISQWFNVTLYPGPPRSSRRSPYTTKPWLIHKFSENTLLADKATIIIIDTDEYLWGISPGAPSTPLKPLAQMYGYGGSWTIKLCKLMPDLCPAKLRKDRKYARRHYMNGVPYVLPMRAFRAIAGSWHTYMSQLVELNEFGALAIYTAISSDYLVLFASASQCSVARDPWRAQVSTHNADDLAPPSGLRFSIHLPANQA